MADTTSTASTLQILIDIRARLDELAKARRELQATKEEGESLGSLLRQGLGIGSGMELARRGIEIFKATIVDTAHRAIEMAGQVRDGSEALQITGEAYQVFSIELGKANVDMGRFSMAVATQTQSLAQLRAGASGAGAAYRYLGLNAAEVEALSPDQRVLAVARATLNATDQTKAFDAAGQILGSRGLPQLLSGLKDLATEGYDKVAKSAKDAGLIMDADTAKRLDRAEKALAREKLRMTIMAGEQIGGADALRESFGKDWSSTLASLLSSGFTGNLGRLSATIANNVPLLEEDPKSKTDEAAKKREQTLREQLKISQRDLLQIQAEQSTAEADGTMSAVDKSAIRLANLNAEVEARQKIVDLSQSLEEFDAKNDPVAFQAALIKAQAELDNAKSALAVALGRGATMPADRLQAQLSDLERQKTFITAIDPTRTEIATRARLLPILDAQIEKTRQLSAALYPDAFDLDRKLRVGDITPDELQRLREYLALQDKLSGLLGERAGYGVPIPRDEQIRQNRSRRQTAAGMTAYDRKLDDAGNINNSADNPDYMTVGQGAAAGAADYVSSLGSQGEQVAAAINSSIGTAVSGISQGIYGWMTGTMSFGEALRNIGGTILQTFIQTIIQMGVQWMVTQTLMKLGLISTHAVGEGLRAQRIAGATAEGAATEAAMAPAAATASISSFGLAAAIGIAALLAVMAAFGGFATGGHFQDRPTGFVTGPGTGTSDSILARVSNKEWIAPEWMVQDPVYGGMIDTLESARKGTPGFRSGGLFGFLTSSLVHGGVPKKMLLPQVNRFFEDYNLINGGKTYGATDASSSSYDYASGKWIQDTAADRYVVTGQNSAGGSSVATTAAGAAEAADSARAQSAVATTESGRPIQVVFLDRTDRSMVEQLKRDPLAEQYFVDLMYQNRAVLGRKI
jgi:hypothetical protein